MKIKKNIYIYILNYYITNYITNFKRILIQVMNIIQFYFNKKFLGWINY